MHIDVFRITYSVGRGLFGARLVIKKEREQKVAI